MSFATRCMFAATFMLLCSAIQAEELTILSPDLPAQSEPGGAGRDSEIVATVLEHCGYDPHFQVVPFGQHLRIFSDVTEINAVTTVADEHQLSGYPSLPYVWYQNGASMLESSQSKPYSVKQLSGLRVVAFVNAARILGFDNLVDTFAEYQELANRRLHSSMLYFGRVDVVLGDGLIFSEINKRLASNPKFETRFNMGESILYVPLFDPVSYKMMFRDRDVRDDFNRCFQELEARGVIRAINVNHVDQHREVVGFGYLGY